MFPIYSEKKKYKEGLHAFTLDIYSFLKKGILKFILKYSVSESGCYSLFYTYFPLLIAQNDILVSFVRNGRV